ncbi:hypothetical protein K402DRAFT_410857 [Aulographum hederae CBS 113979]|uniref:DUF1254-domain-containing protein n=1 Tax=Aulographum hederae CBS 113979 TaxID=1176131 RepID=A0A6G1H934_9PEZI|nr:hypothetical protein K402DRAFT_410857 [Aulographum hederae CBS 113979]
MFVSIRVLALILGIVFNFAQACPTRPAEILRPTNATAFTVTKNLANAGQAAIVRPNVDTLYSKIAIDLSQMDVVLTIPEVKDGRFYVFPFYDLWSNNFENLGSLNSTVLGKYLLRLAHASDNIVFQPADDGPDACEYLGFVNFQTTYGLVLPRILLRNNSSDLDVVHQIQAGIKVEQVPRKGCSDAPALTTTLLGNGTLDPMALENPAALNESSIRQLLQVVARVAPFNKPADPQEARRVEENFRAAGLSDGHYLPPLGLNFTLVSGLVKSSLLTAPQLTEPFNNGWVDFPPEFSGDFHQQYVIRSLIAFTGYLQLVQYEALYPQWQEGGDLSLAHNQSYIMTFPSGKPPVKGFWSLTTYNSSSYLISNPLDRYALGDRSNLTYPDGRPLYGNDDTDGPFSILLQSADLPPPSNWTSNWLPAPAGGGNFTVNLRFYGPTQPLIAGGSYLYPVVTKQDAIVG